MNTIESVNHELDQYKHQEDKKENWNLHSLSNTKHQLIYGNDIPSPIDLPSHSGKGLV